MMLMAISGVMVALLTVVERRWPARTEPAPRRLNLGLWAFRLALQFSAIPLVGLAVATAARSAGAPSLNIAAWPLAFSALALALAMDLAEYLYHRAQHAIPWLWERHSLHHSDPCVSATTTERHWWGDMVLKAVLIGAPAGILLGPAPADYVIYGALSLWNYVAHANLKLNFGRWSWVLNSPAYHRLHHARAAEHHGANYAALFPIFDVVAGSYRPATDWLETGLDVEPKRLLDALAWPPARPDRAIAS
jgi:sterol desaturase/sphingolipid hydroxylase (fatty acid hydroxylase superfamily)